jgi:hypothetical protein
MVIQESFVSVGRLAFTQSVKNQGSNFQRSLTYVWCKLSRTQSWTRNETPHDRCRREKTQSWYPQENNRGRENMEKKTRRTNYYNTDTTRHQRPTLILSVNKSNNKKMMRDWLLTVVVRQNQKKHMLSQTLPNIRSCTLKVFHQYSEEAHEKKHMFSKTFPNIRIRRSTCSQKRSQTYGPSPIPHPYGLWACFIW